MDRKRQENQSKNIIGTWREFLRSDFLWGILHMSCEVKAYENLARWGVGESGATAGNVGMAVRF